VGERHDLEPSRPTEAVEEPEDEIPGQAEHVRDAGPLEVGDQEVA
jgi:hypothetical protein